MKEKTRKMLEQDLARFIRHPARWTASVAGTNEVRRLEERFAGLTGHQYGLATANATTGLWAAFLALGIHGSEVITTPYTWGGSLAGIMFSGNYPVFADIDSETLTIDPARVEDLITANTAAILAVDIYGYPCDASQLRKLAHHFGLAFVQDCSQSLGALFRGHHTGHWADVAVFSMGFGKEIFAGEGGVILTGSKSTYQNLIALTQHPQRQMRDIPLSPVNEFAMNLRINPLAALWATELFDDALAAVKKERQFYTRILKVLFKDGICRMPTLQNNSADQSFHVVTIDPIVSRATIEHHPTLKEHEIEIDVPPITLPLYQHRSYRRIAIAKGFDLNRKCPVAEEQCRNRIRLVHSHPRR
jgi:dTDP-4-amino-4,6-dideoxygalactose transaminase